MHHILLLDLQSSVAPSIPPDFSHGGLIVGYLSKLGLTNRGGMGNRAALGGWEEGIRPIPLEPYALRIGSPFYPPHTLQANWSLSPFAIPYSLHHEFIARGSPELQLQRALTFLGRATPTNEPSPTHSETPNVVHTTPERFD